MTKISVSRLFDKAQIASTQAGKDLEPFIDYITQFVDNIGRALRNGVTVSDNVSGKFFTFELQHNVQSTVLINASPQAILIAQAPLLLSDGNTAPQITSFAWSNSSTAGQVNLLITTDTPSSTDKISVRFLVIYS